MFQLVYYIALFASSNQLIPNYLVHAGDSKVEPKLLQELKNGDRVNVIISFKSGIASTLESVTMTRHANRESRNTAIKASLEATAKSSQGGVVHMLSTRSASNGGFQYFKRYWASNKIFIKSASAEVVEQIAQDPEVSRIVKEPILRIPTSETSEGEDMHARGGDDIAWNILKIKAPEAWKELGSQGEGITVGIIDTGVRHTHEAFRDRFVGTDYGWKDALFNKTEPYDTNGHGTHVLGTLAGSHGVGVAPGVKWMACLACDSGCPGEALLDCMQWMSCPTLQDGSNADCSKAPHVINNSWMSDRGETGYNEDIMRWRAMNIIPIFAIGNVGVPYCEQTTSPGEQSLVIGVGSVTRKLIHDIGSAIGPAADGSIKPDIVAPGIAVYSSVFNSDTSYWGKWGTSMAAPHVAGVVALLKVREPDLSFERAYSLVMENTDHDVILNPGYLKTYCNLSSPDVIPNIFFGYGMVNALKTLRAQSAELGNVD